MKSLLDAFPPDVAAQVHPDWKKNEAEYWAQRDKLLDEYRDQWIAFAGGAVIVSGTNSGDVFTAAHESGRHPFVTRVGSEDEPWCRMRRVAFAYDPGEGGQ